MTFQAYLDTIKAKTGKTVEDFRELAQERGLLEPGTKVGEIVAWLKADFDLGPGHSMALVGALGMQKGAGLGADERIDAQFTGAKSRWRSSYESLLKTAEGFGAVGIAPTNTYVSLLKGTKKFALVQVVADRIDVGIKLPGKDATGRLESAGTWNSMVTHRVRVTEPEQLDTELYGWLREAYDRA